MNARSRKTSMVEIGWAEHGVEAETRILHYLLHYIIYNRVNMTANVGLRLKNNKPVAGRYGMH